jgi:2,3-diketo-5-methylthio-1-phosphopentane phosphatase
MLDFLYQTFSADGLKFAKLWEEGKITTQEEIELTFASVTASREEMELAVAKMPLDPNFTPFFELCRRKGLEFAVVSEGLRWYIDFMLEREGIREVEIYANEIIFTDHGIRFEYPHFHGDCPERGVCKSNIVNQYKQAGKRVIFIGDGKSDYEAAETADLVFATRKLATYCAEQGLPAVNFTDFGDLISKWDEHLLK